MTITAQDILTKLGYKAWSGFNIDDMVFDSEDSAQAREELNGALRYLLNLEDFPFRAKTKDLMLIEGIEQYSVPIGQITEIYNAETLEPLIYLGNGNEKDQTLTGKPSGFWINAKNPKEKLRIYPIPDDTYNYTIVYNQFQPVKKQDGSLSFEFSDADDYINLPSRLEALFVDCLVLRTMAQNNKDEQDENYAPTLKEFDETWRLFKKACKSVKVTPRIIF